MASRAERKRRTRKAAEVRHWFELGLFDDDQPRTRNWQFKIDVGPMVKALQDVDNAFRVLASKMRELTLAARRAAWVRRPPLAYPTPTAPRRPRCPARRRPGAFRLPRGGGRWSAC